MSKDILKTILLKGVWDDYLDMLNMLGKEDISKESYDEIVNLCKRCSRGVVNRPKNRDSTYSRVQKSASGAVTRAEIGNLLEEFKIEMLSSFTSQIDTLQVKKKKAEAEAALAIFCPKCREKHPLRECPLDKCNDIHLWSGRIVEPIIDDITSSDFDKEEIEKYKSSNKGAETVEPPSKKISKTTEPPFLECLALTKTPEPPAFNFLGELQNLYVKIPFLQALRDLPIYAITVRDICIKKPGRKAKDLLTVHVMGDLAALMSGKTPPMKYGDPGHPTVIVQVGKTIVSRVLVDLGAAINIMTLETAQLLQLKNVIRETPTILELADHSTIKPEGVIEDLIILVESWNYLADFVVLQTKTKLGGHPLILGRLWLATTDAFISYRSGSMTISDGCETK
eukprot:PITA_36019